MRCNPRCKTKRNRRAARTRSRRKAGPCFGETTGCHRQSLELAAVEVELEYPTGIERVRRYELAYTDSPDNNRSLLDTAQLFGQNSLDALPAMDFDYQWTNPPAIIQDAYPGFDITYDVIADPAGWGLQDQDGSGNITGELRDINGDGHLDLVEAFSVSKARWKVWFGHGAAGFDEKLDYTWWDGAPHALREITPDASGAPDVTVEFIDMNGDGARISTRGLRRSSGPVRSTSTRAEVSRSSRGATRAPVR